MQAVNPNLVYLFFQDDTVGGGEGLAEPPEGLNTSDIEKEVAEVPLVNGNHVEDVKPVSTSPDVIKLNMTM